ncbi:hypothetical protein [Mycobacteroides salmoniphilum]|uniref:hypothetical protein n=1 Tax=Mycobacteroides salmoniphilum TaxID=404941 RepID=UPI000991C897|nr:hypothetical protein [Mycobacteroides salmoniphilum]
MTQNELLLDVNVFPDYGLVRIEDLGTKEVPEDDGEKIWVLAHAVYVITMTADAADMANRGVQVRVLRGSDYDDLGELMFDQELTLDSGILAIGSVVDGDDTLHKVQLPRSGKFPVRILTASNIPPEGLDWPIEDVTEINILI